MDEFTAKYAEKMHGVISGFDRLVFRGTLRAIRYAEGMKAYLIRKEVWVGDFAQHVQAVSERLKQSSLAEARRTGADPGSVGSAISRRERRIIPIASPSTDGNRRLQNQTSAPVVAMRLIT